MKTLSKRKAFTLLELVFVTVILGIVASIGSSVIVQVYESYIMQRSVHNASLKTELAINQLTNRLTYRINRSLLARVEGATTLNPADALPLAQVPLGNTTHNALEWIGYDNDGFSAQNPPTWSGFCDLNASNFANVKTRASRLKTTTTAKTSAQVVLDSLSRSINAPAPAIIFIGPNVYKNNAGVDINYDTLCMHRTDGTGCMFPVTLPNNSTLRFRTAGKIGDRVNGEMVYSEFYQLAASAYAAVPENKHQINNKDVWDIYLYADYQPWNGDNYAQGSRSLLAKNVSVFRFRQESNSIRIKICSVEQVGETDTISICKEKAVIR